MDDDELLDARSGVEPVTPETPLAKRDTKMNPFISAAAAPAAPIEIQEVKYGKKSKGKYANKQEGLKNNVELFDIPMSEQDKLLLVSQFALKTL